MRTCWGHIERRVLQCYGHNKEPLLRGCVLCPLINLFPQSEVVVHATVKVRVEGNAGYIVEHEV